MGADYGTAYRQLQDSTQIRADAPHLCLEGAIFVEMSNGHAHDLNPTAC
jgi:hypothetical protein